MTYEDAIEVVAQHGGLLGSDGHAPASAEYLAYDAIVRPGFDLARVTSTMAARPRAYGGIVAGDAAPRPALPPHALPRTVSKGGARIDLDLDGLRPVLIPALPLTERPQRRLRVA